MDHYIVGGRKGNKIEFEERDSLSSFTRSALYSAITYYTGFKVNSGEYKVMGLAPYGEPKYKDLIYQNLLT